ncbi:YncE family protein [Hymenobacter terrenus]|uniref:hypothetical protein n=1 Tax=Hymenobacter terrenus TaxID=1629124 RepID=UPI0006190BBC|nr:hypothetical protein [Hymenobacter terrenus]
MKHHYLPKKRLTQACLLLALLLSLASTSQAQVYYTLFDAVATAGVGDELRRVQTTGTGDAPVTTSFAGAPGTIVVDAANNRAFVADVRSTAPAILVFNLGSGAPTTLLTFSSGNVPTGLALDPVNNYLYYISAMAPLSQPTTSYAALIPTARATD